MVPIVGFWEASVGNLLGAILLLVVAYLLYRANRPLTHSGQYVALGAVASFGLFLALNFTVGLVTA